MSIFSAWRRILPVTAGLAVWIAVVVPGQAEPQYPAEFYWGERGDPGFVHALKGDKRPYFLPKSKPGKAEIRDCACRTPLFNKFGHLRHRAAHPGLTSLHGRIHSHRLFKVRHRHRQPELMAGHSY